MFDEMFRKNEDKDEYQFLADETETTENDWGELDDAEDDFDALMRKKERRDAERFAWSVLSIGVLSFIALSVAFYRKFLS